MRIEDKILAVSLTLFSFRNPNSAIRSFPIFPSGFFSKSPRFRNPHHFVNLFFIFAGQAKFFRV